MSSKRIIDKETGIFIRDSGYGDDLKPDREEIIEVTIPNGMYAVEGVCPVWDGEKWVQNVKPPTPEPQPQEPSLEDRIQALEVMELERILGGGF